ncbi:TetR/AcrR family transcriptional regulator [Antrihabitans cavernicola]|uniref:TetR family transcriptional regulator n=1 Tax=Antrihabitans cavernicola TaxID=2495913 RepID=A0A5A7SFJ8_9NOCA|nr:TetR/AcrR family transcriptional regulator [Spelaeibacter cavernicola]KAA0023952.1 TetR family transcriptional regulator [Spelaeibacter cavernicola]
MPAAPRSRRERPAKPALTRSGIIDSAIEIMRAEGLDRVTMRRLAQALDTGPASLYVYVSNTAELHAAVLDELLGSIDLKPVDGEGDWSARLIEVLTSYTAVLFDYPGLAQSALVARPSGDNYLDLLEALLALLHQGGIAPERAAWAVDLLLQFGTATAAEHASATTDFDALRTAIREQDRPRIVAVRSELLSGTGQERLAWGFRVLINGTLHTPRK